MLTLIIIIWFRSCIKWRGDQVLIAIMSSKRGYSLVSTVDPDSFASSSNYGAAANSSTPDVPVPKKKTKAIPRSLRPGLFVQFGDRGKFAPALAKCSESENEGERIELVPIKPRRSKLKRGRLKSPKSGGYDRNKTIVIDEPILPGDTIQRVALRYGCRVSVDTCHQEIFTIICETSKS